MGESSLWKICRDMQSHLSFVKRDETTNDAMRCGNQFTISLEITLVRQREENRVCLSCRLSCFSDCTILSLLVLFKFEMVYVVLPPCVGCESLCDDVWTIYICGVCASYIYVCCDGCLYMYLLCIYVMWCTVGTRSFINTGYGARDCCEYSHGSALTFLSTSRRL